MIRHLLRTRLLLLSLAAWSAGATAQPMLTIPDTTGRKGDTLLIPVMLTGIGANSVYAVQATVTLNNSHVEVIGVSTTGSLTSGGTASYFTTTQRLAIALSTPVTSDGVLFYLRAVLSGVPGQQATLGLASLVLNEGTPAATVDAGIVRLRKVTIAPAYLSNVAEGDSVQFSVSGDIVPPLAWSTSSSIVGTIDGTGKFRAVTPGFVTVTVTDGEGKKDSTNQFNVVPSIIKSLTLWIPDTSRTQTLEVAVPVRVTTVTGLGIVSAQFRVTFNTSDLQYLGLQTAGSMTASWGPPVVNDLSPGVLDLALAGSDTLEGAGTLLWIHFRVKPSAAGSSVIGLANAVFNESINPALDPGTFTVIAAPLIKVNTGRTVVYKGETIPVTSVTGGTSPFTFTSSNPAIATVDASTGTMTVLTRGPVLIQAVDAQGFPGSSDTIRAYDFAVSLPDTSVSPGDSVDVPMQIGLTDGLGIVAYQFRLAYDTSIVRFRGLVLDGTMSAAMTPVVKDSASVLRVAVAGTTPLTGQGVLLKLRFAPHPPSISNEQTTLAVSSFAFNEPGPGTPLAYAMNGKVRVVFPDQPPVFTKVLPDTSIVAGTTLTFTYIASDPDADPVRYYKTSGPAFASIDSMTGVLTFSPGPAIVGGFTLQVSAIAGGVTIATTATVTVTSPSTTVEMPSGVVPDAFALLPNFPNPFNPATMIRFTVPSESHVVVRILDPLGRVVATLADRTFAPGNYEARWDATGMASGLYLSRIEAVNGEGERFVGTGKMLLLR